LPAEESPTPKHGQGGPCPSTLRVSSQIRTPPHHAPALEGQAPACPPKNPRRPNPGKEDLARIHPAGRIANPNATAHAPALEGQAPACPPKDPRRPNTGKEDLAPPPCGSPLKSERHRITRQLWRGKLPLARRRIHHAQTRARKTSARNTGIQEHRKHRRKSTSHSEGSGLAPLRTSPLPCFSVNSVGTPFPP
jgi:hypothetical protein